MRILTKQELSCISAAAIELHEFNRLAIFLGCTTLGFASFVTMMTGIGTCATVNYETQGKDDGCTRTTFNMQVAFPAALVATSAISFLIGRQLYNDPALFQAYMVGTPVHNGV